MKNNLESRIKTIISTALRIPIAKVGAESNRSDFEEWDSLGHLVLIEALCKEFDISIPAEDALQMESVQDIQEILAEGR